MSNPYLIAHLVRGASAFDIAIRFPSLDEPGEEAWIIPTSGHRAYPYWYVSLELGLKREHYGDSWLDHVPDCPQDWPDHYPHSSSPSPRSAKLDLASLGLSRPQPKIVRRV